MKEEKKKHGCLRVFVWIIGIIIVIVAILAIMIFDVPTRLGLIKSPSEKLLSGTPDREAASDMLTQLEAAGMDTTGMEIFIIPVAESDGHYIAYAVMDASEGFVFGSLTGEDPITMGLVNLATSGVAQEMDITQFGMEYRDQEGTTLMAIGASADTVTAFAAGTISREEFMTSIEGDVNVVALVEDMYDSIYGL